MVVDGVVPGSVWRRCVYPYDKVRVIRVEDRGAGEKRTRVVYISSMDGQEKTFVRLVDFRILFKFVLGLVG